jgi:hypothetical protein
MHQGIDQSSALLLDSNGNGAASEPALQELNPAPQVLRRLIECEALPPFTISLLQSDDVFLIRPIQSDKRGDFRILFRHQQISPSSPFSKTVPAGSAHKPYSRVLEGQHLSICPASRADRVRKSPVTVYPVGWLIRNATQSVFHKGNLFQKEKEKRTKKEKENLWKMPHPWKSASIIGSLRRHFLDADSHRCLEKPRLTLGFPTFPTGPTTILNMTIQKSFLKNYKGWLRQ